MGDDMTVPQVAVASMRAAAASALAFVAAAKAGEVAVNENGGKPLLDAIGKMLAWIDDRQFDLYQLSQEPKLGSSNSARVMKPYMVQVATDANGFVTQLMAFRETLRQAEEAIRMAMANYRSVDDEIAGKYSGGE
jgi:hypothetical protein